MQQITQTAGDQKTTRAWINKYATKNIGKPVVALLRYLANNCYFQKKGALHRTPRDFEVSQYTLSKHMYCSLRSVQAHLDAAVASGFISIIKGGKRDGYALHIDTKNNHGFKPTRLVEQEQRINKKQKRSAYDRKHRAQTAVPNMYEVLDGDVATA